MFDGLGRRARSLVGPLASVLVVLGGGVGCKPEPEGVALQPSNGSALDTPVELVVFDNDRDESVLGVMLRPDSLPSPVPMPAVVLLHGSGGLFTKPDGDDEQLQVEQQFSDWATLLGPRGYVVLMPSSFYSRGYFDWGDHPSGLDDTDRLIMRTYDAYGALHYACKQPFVDCDRVAVMGFSNGGSATLMSMHEGLEDVEGMAELTPAVERERFVRAVSYYPGCELESLVDRTGQPYFSTAPITIEHASKDSLVEPCAERVEQVEATAQARALESPLTLTIHEGADHGFDGAPRNEAEVRARDEARARTLEELASALAP